MAVNPSSPLPALRQRLEPHTALLVESPATRFYLTGFASSDGLLVVLPDRAVFLIDSRYSEKAAMTVTDAEVRQSRYQLAEIAELLQDAGCRRLYVETEHTSIRRLASLRQGLPAVEVAEDDRYDRLLTELRRIKSSHELMLLRQAQALTDETFTYILDRIEAGRTERDVLLDMEFYMRRRGSEGVSFDFIVVSGKNSSLPHGVATDKVIEKGDFLTMDFGAVVGGYHADMTRTVAVGSVSDEQRRAYETVLAAQTAALAAVAPGRVCRDIDRIARDIIDSAGYAGCFGHGLGHSVGVEIHESPAFSPRCETVLQPGMVMTVEPGVYLEGRFGLRIEDMVAVTENGCENLTASPKELLIL